MADCLFLSSCDKLRVLLILMFIIGFIFHNLENLDDISSDILVNRGSLINSHQNGTFTKTAHFAETSSSCAHVVCDGLWLFGPPFHDILLDISTNRDRLIFLNHNGTSIGTSHLAKPSPPCAHVVCDGLWSVGPCLLFAHNGNYRFHSRNRRSWGSILTTLLLLLSGQAPNPGPTQDNEFITLGYLNVNSVVRKGPLLRDLIEETSCDVIVLSETKLRSDDTDQTRFGGLPEHYAGLFKDRSSDNRGGGLAVVHRDTIRIVDRTAKYASPSTYELLVVNIESGSNCVTLVNIYRPPSTSLSMFLEELTNLLQQLAQCGDRWIIGGDLNCPGDTPGTVDQGLLDILELFDLKQWVNGQTHNGGGLLDLIITPADSRMLTGDTLISLTGFSDHCLLSTRLSMTRKHERITEIKKQRSFKNFNVNKFENLFSKTAIVTNPVDDVNGYVEQFNVALTSVLDVIAPMKTVTRRRRGKDKSWLSEDAKKAKRTRRRHERKWCKTKSECDRIAYRKSCREANALIMESRRSYFAELVSNASDNMRTLWRTVNGILHPSVGTGATTLTSSVLADFFIGKVSRTITTIASKLSLLNISRMADVMYRGEQFNCIEPVTALEVAKLISSSPNKTSPLDQLPTHILKLCARILSPFIARIANLSFRDGVFPTSFKCARVTPILKKQGLNIEDPANYRPISNLQTLSKLLEKLYLSRLRPHLATTGRMDPFQSAYRSNCSTETALVKLFGDLYDGMDGKKITLLVTLDISAAFDTIDSSILVERLQVYFGVNGMPLKWISSYLENRSQYVMLNGIESPINVLQAGVPQGSVLGPILFSAFIAPLSDLVESFKVDHHQYADDANLYHSFSAPDQQNCINHMSLCLDSVNNWFLTNGLLVNPSKSDSMYVGTTSQINKINASGVVMGGTAVPLSDSIKSLGVIIDNQLTLEKHVLNVCRSCYYHIKGLRSLRPSLNDNTAETVGRSIVMSRLDYCNALLASTSGRNIHRLQMVQNNLVRVVTGAHFRASARPLLSSLHWLPVEQRIKYKLAMCVFKSRINHLPVYLSSDLVEYSSSRPMRSMRKNTYKIPRVRTEIVKRGFQYAGPRNWNDLPDGIRSITSLPLFRKQLKTYLFNECFN